MVRRTHTEILVNILEVLSKNGGYSYNHLEKKVRTNWKSIRDHCHELEAFGAITITEDKRVKITSLGRCAIKRLKKN